ncbi:pilin [Spirillospora sp. NPDC052269]
MAFEFSAGDGSSGPPLDAAEATFQLPAGKTGSLAWKGHEYAGGFPSRKRPAVRAGQISSAAPPMSSPAGRLHPRGLLRSGGGWLRRGLTVVLIVAVVVLVIAIAARAQVPFAPPDQDDPKAQLGKIIDNLRTWLIGFLVGLATLMATFGGLRYLLAGGDPGEVAKAKNTLRSAAIGYGIAALAPVLVSALKKIVGV